MIHDVAAKSQRREEEEEQEQEGADQIPPL